MIGKVDTNYHTGSSQIKMLALCLMCTVVYVYLYTNIALKTETVSILVKRAIVDLEDWTKNLKLYLNIPVNQSIESTVRQVGKDAAKTSTFLLVIFTTFTDSAEKYVCRNNTIRNWLSFGGTVKPIFFSDDTNLIARVKEKGWHVLLPSKTAVGIPILKYMYMDVMKHYPSKFYAYVNGDILFTQGLVDTLQFILSAKKINQTHPMLIVGQRTNVKHVSAENASSHENIIKISKTGKLFTTWGEDYFITNSNYPWKDCPEVVVGRVAYDNWLVLNANKRRHTTIDATRTLLALHQTTKKGNGEGRSHPNAHYNGNILRKLYNKINYGAGLTSCTRKYTVCNSTNNQIQLMERKGC